MSTTNGSSPYPDRLYRNMNGVDLFCFDKSRSHQGPVDDPFCIHDALVFCGTWDHASFVLMGLIGRAHVVGVGFIAHYSFRCCHVISK